MSAPRSGARQGQRDCERPKLFPRLGRGNETVQNDQFLPQLLFFLVRFGVGELKTDFGKLISRFDEIVVIVQFDLYGFEDRDSFIEASVTNFARDAF